MWTGLAIDDRIVILIAVFTMGDGFDLFDLQFTIDHVFMFGDSPVPTVFKIYRHYPGDRSDL